MRKEHLRVLCSGVWADLNSPKEGRFSSMKSASFRPKRKALFCVFSRSGNSSVSVELKRIRADVRVIAATNRDLKAAMMNGTFRSDLFYRLQVFPIEIPPLRERKEDIPLLVEYFIDRYASKMGKKIRGINQKSLELLQSYFWPGNIRELQNVIERAVIVC